MFQERVPSDVVKAVFHYLGENTRFSANVPKIHETFFNISQNSDFKGLCRDFVFDTSMVFPYCATIGYALDRLQKADLLACRNPGLDEYEVSKSLADEKEVEELFDDNERDLLKRAADMFQTQISG
jgi:hypothetical protein